MRMYLLLFLLCAVYKQSLPATIDHDNGDEAEDHWKVSWDYDGSEGPDNWPKISPTCAGTRQSPINISDYNEQYISYKEAFSFYNFDVIPFQGNMTNNGHTVNIKFQGLNDASGVCGFLPGEYKFASFHFHWGKDSLEGSEHLHNGYAHPMELHMIFFKKELRSVNNALKHPFGVAVLAVWFVETDGPSPFAYRDLVRSLQYVRKPHTWTSFYNEHSLFDYLPRNMDSFYRYTGSLTTPPCIEPIIWTVFDHPISINAKDLQQFRKLKNPEGKLIAGNFRPPQDLHDRRVQRYVVTDDVRYPKHFSDPDDFLYRGLNSDFCDTQLRTVPYTSFKKQSLYMIRA